MKAMEEFIFVSLNETYYSAETSILKCIFNWEDKIV